MRDEEVLMQRLAWINRKLETTGRLKAWRSVRGSRGWMIFDELHGGPCKRSPKVATYVRRPYVSLVCAAPELLGACKAALAWIDMGYWSNEARSTATRERLLAAITEAESDA